MQRILRVFLKPKRFSIQNLTRKLTDDITMSPSAPAGGEPSVSSPPAERIKRQEPGKVMLGFIPVEWAEEFYSRTGVTGFGTFCFTCGMFTISKEILVMEHEYYGGLSTVIMWYLIVTHVGPGFAKSLDKEIDDYEKGWNEGRVNEQALLEGYIETEKKLQLSSEGQLMLLDAKRENVLLQLEANFRERQMMAYKEVKSRLDYYVKIEEIERRFAQKNIVAWVTDQVLKSITPEQENRNIDKCIEDLAAMAK